MCLPIKTDQSPHALASPSRSMLGMRALMVLACFGGPALAAIGGLGVGVLLGAGGMLVAFALCAAVPAVTVALHRRSARRAPTTEL
jgi:hypothetical protein